MIPYPIRTPPAVTPGWSAVLAAAMLVPLVLQDLPDPFAVWVVLALAYVAVETLGRSPLDVVAGGPGWPILIAMVVALEPDGSLLGAGLAVVAATVVDALRSRHPRRPGDRILATVPPLVVVALASTAAGTEGIRGVVAYGDRGIGLVVAAATLSGIIAHLLSHRLVPALGADTRVTPGDLGVRPVLEAAAMGATAGLLGVLITNGGWVAFPLGLAGLLVVASLEHGNRRLALAQQATVASLLMALEARDVYTRGHAMRVAELAALIADEMELPPVRTERLVTAALLHDIGKVVTPRHLLRKPGRLTPAEYARVQEHAGAAEVLLRRIRFLDEAATIVSEHHLHVDGGGYGATGAGGPSLEARIVAVADCFDAMTSHRPYRRALSRTYACAELRRCAGSQFDAEVVEALIRRLDDVGEVPTVVGADSDETARRGAELEAVR